MSSRHVHLIDADPNLGAFLQSELERRGYRVDVSQDANDLLARQDGAPHLVVLCIDPKRTGWTVCNRLRKSPLLKAVPLIVTSSEATKKDFDDHKKLKTRAEDYLHKPFKPDALADRVAALIGVPDGTAAADEIPVVDVDEGTELPAEDPVTGLGPVPGGLGHLDPPIDEPPVTGFGVASSSFVREESQDRTSIRAVDDEVDLEADQAFAAIALDEPSPVVEEELPQVPSPWVTRSSRNAIPEPEAESVEEESEPVEEEAEPVALEEPDHVAQRGEEPFTLPPRPLSAGSLAVPEPVQPEEVSVEEAELVDDVEGAIDELPVELVDTSDEEPAQAREAAPMGGALVAEVPVLADTAEVDLRAFTGGADQEALRRERDALKDEARTLASARDALQRELKAAQSERDRLRGERDEAALQRDAIKSERDAASGGRAQLEREIDDLKAKLSQQAPAAPGLAREREFLSLRETINKKEKEILDLRDALDAKERQILDSKDKLREHDRRSRDLDDKLLATEKELVGAREKLEVLAADKERAVEREKQVKARLEDAQKGLARADEEIARWQKKHAADTAAIEAQRAEAEAAGARALEKLRAQVTAEREALAAAHAEEKGDLAARAEAEKAQALAELTRAHEEALARLRAGHETTLAEREQVRADEVAGLRARHAQEQRAAEELRAREVEAAVAEGREALAAARREAEAALEAASQRHAAELQATREELRGELATLKREHAEATERAAEAHRGELARVAEEQEAAQRRIETAHEAALHALDEQRREELAEAARARAAEVAQVTAAFEERRAADQAAAKAAQAKALHDLEQAHADMKAGMQQRHTSELETLNRQAAATLAEFESALAERDRLIQDANGRLAELEGMLTTEKGANQHAQARIGQLENELSQARVESEARRQRLEDADRRIGELEQESAAFQEQILKAHHRIKTDEVTVQRARKALAIALTVLDESEGN